MHRSPRAKRIGLAVVGVLFPAILAAQSNAPVAPVGAAETPVCDFSFVGPIAIPVVGFCGLAFQSSASTGLIQTQSSGVPAALLAVAGAGFLRYVTLSGQAPSDAPFRPPVLSSSYVYTSVLTGNAGSKECAVVQDCQGGSTDSWSNAFAGASSYAPRIFKDAIVDRQLDANRAAEDPVSERDVGDGHGKGKDNGNNGNNGNNGGNGNNGSNSNSGSGSQGNAGGNGNGNTGTQGNAGGNGNGISGGNGNEDHGNGGDHGENSGGTGPTGGGDHGDDHGSVGGSGGGSDEGGNVEEGPGGDDGGSNNGDNTLPTQTTPEPGTVILLGTGVVGLALAQRKRRS